MTTVRWWSRFSVSSCFHTKRLLRWISSSMMLVQSNWHHKAVRLLHVRRQCQVTLYHIVSLLNTMKGCSRLLKWFCRPSDFLRHPRPSSRVRAFQSACDVVPMRWYGKKESSIIIRCYDPSLFGESSPQMNWLSQLTSALVSVVCPWLAKDAGFMGLDAAQGNADVRCERKYQGICQEQIVRFWSGLARTLDLGWSWHATINFFIAPWLPCVPYHCPTWIPDMNQKSEKGTEKLYDKDTRHQHVLLACGRQKSLAVSNRRLAQCIDVPSGCGSNILQR